MAHFALLTVAMLFVGTPGWALARQQPVAPAGGRITYLTSSTGYVDVGREEGLEEGMVVEVVRAGRGIGSMKVSYLASHRASGAILRADSTLVVGDSIAFTPIVLRGRGGPGVAPVASRPTRSTRSSAAGHLRGRLGLRYLLVQPIGGAGYRQPAADLRLEGVGLGGSPAGVLVDVRARQTLRKREDGTTVKEVQTTVYQAAVSLRANGGPQLTVGRQYLPTVSSVSLFDGAMVGLQRSRIGAGAFIGSEPDPRSMGYSTDIRSYGLFVEGRNAPGATTRWSLAGGAVGSYAPGAINREFGFLQASLSSPTVSIFAAQELDLNRTWKAEAGEPSVTWTSTFATVQVRPAEWMTLQGGVDNRRSVRLYRDLIDPETEFDDSFRQGIWGGTSFQFGKHTRVGGDARRTLGGAGTASHTSSLNGYATVDRLTPLRLSLRGRVNRYQAVERSGSLQSLGVTARPTSWLGLGVTGGRRQESGTVAPEGRSMNWYAVDLDAGLGRSVYFLFSGSRERGSLAAGDQVFVSLSYRF